MVWKNESARHSLSRQGIKTKTEKELSNNGQFTQRIRFNWGYHDGAMHTEHKWKTMWKHPHFDKIYEEGFILGVRDFRNGEYKGDSTNAWKEYNQG